MFRCEQELLHIFKMKTQFQILGSWTIQKSRNDVIYYSYVDNCLQQRYQNFSLTPGHQTDIQSENDPITGCWMSFAKVNESWNLKRVCMKFKFCKEKRIKILLFQKYLNGTQ